MSSHPIVGPIVQPTPLQPHRLPLSDLLPAIDEARPEVYPLLRGTCKWWQRIVDVKVAEAVDRLAPPQLAFLLAGRKPIHHIGEMLAAGRRNDALQARVNLEKTVWKKPARRPRTRSEHLFFGGHHLMASTRTFWGNKRTHMLHVDAHGHEQWTYVAAEWFFYCEFTDDLRYFVGDARDENARTGALTRPQLWERRDDAHHFASSFQPRYRLLGYLPPSLGAMFPIAVRRLPDGAMRFVAQADHAMVVADQSLNFTEVKLPRRHDGRLKYHAPSDSAFVVHDNRLARCHLNRQNEGWTSQRLGRGSLQSWRFSQNASRLVTVTRKGASSTVTAWDIANHQAHPLLTYETSAEVELKAINADGRNIVFSATSLQDGRRSTSLVHVDVDTQNVSASSIPGRAGHVVFAPLKPALYAAIIEEDAQHETFGAWLYRPTFGAEEAPLASRLPTDLSRGAHFVGFDGLARHLYVRQRGGVLTYNLAAVSRDAPRRPLWQWGVDRLSVALGMRDGI